MKKKKYALYPGLVVSKSDGDEHYITAPRLADLYGVPLDECIVIDIMKPSTYLGRDTSKLIKLFTRDDGDYLLPL